jgi:hypothetical protein
MPTPHPLDPHIGAGRDLLGYTPSATPSADTWLATFARDFVAHADGAHGADALMSGLRYYTPAFMAEIAALPPVESRLPPLPGSAARAIYTAAQPILLAVYATQIGPQAEVAAIRAAFAHAMPGLLAHTPGAPAAEPRLAS